MSLIKHLLIFSFILLILTSCEDNKKASADKDSQSVVMPKSKTEIVDDTISGKSITETKLFSEEKKYPKITQENVVEFLTNYGLDNPETKVRISTLYGNIDILLFKETPLHRANFIYLVKQHYFDITFFHRVVPNFIIQGGNSDNRSTSVKRSKIGKDYLLPAEINLNRKHRFGSISGAKEYRKNPDNKSFPFEFFIFLGPLEHTRHLNGDYTIFGKVTNGMDIVEKIANLPADKGDWPLDNVYIKAEIIE